jgi:hypothetical protein
MILPTKRITSNRALISIGAEILEFVSEPKTISQIWEELKQKRVEVKNYLSYDWFILAIDFLYLINAVDFKHEKICKVVS